MDRKSVEQLKTSLRTILPIPLEIVIIVATLALYIISLNIFTSPETDFIPLAIGMLIILEIVFFVVVEVKTGVKKHGWKHEIVDTVIAIVIALILWFGATIVLNTSTPVSGVVSCSMLPNLERGDFIIVQGAETKAYEISMTRSELESLNGPVTAFADGMEYLVPMPLYSYCNCNPADSLCRKFDKNPESVVEKTGPFTYHYAMCGFDYKNEDMTGYGKCLEYVEFKGKKYYANLSHDTIVYMPASGDLYGNVGDIVHRAFFKIDVDGDRYYLTKGDNNPIMDIQVVGCGDPEIMNHPVPEENVKGKVIGRIPYLGYLKLLISGYWHEDSQCKWIMDYATVG